MKKGPSIRTDQSGAEKGTRQEMTHSILKSFLHRAYLLKETKKRVIVMLVTHSCSQFAIVGDIFWIYLYCYVNSLRKGMLVTKVAKRVFQVVLEVKIISTNMTQIYF